MAVVRLGTVRFMSLLQVSHTRNCNPIALKDFSKIQIEQALKELKSFTSGWLNYYSIAEMHNRMQKINEWLRCRIRMRIWKHWKKIKVHSIWSLELKIRMHHYL